jgi:hypothetical protein
MQSKSGAETGPGREKNLRSGKEKAAQLQAERPNGENARSR